MFQNPYICTIDFYQNKLKYLPPEGKLEDLDFDADDDDNEVLWSCGNLKSLKLAENQLARIPKAIHGCSKLEKLNVAKNDLISFVQPWNCAMVVHFFWLSILNQFNSSKMNSMLISAIRFKQV